MPSKGSERPVTQRIIEHGAKHYWDKMLASLERGEKLHVADIIHGLRSGHPTPQDMREYIADVLEKRASFRRGANKNHFLELRDQIFRTDFQIQFRVAERYERITKKKLPDRKQAILERVAAKHDVSVTTVRKALEKKL